MKPLSSNIVKNARKVLRDAFDKDPDFRRVYEDNIAMLLYDKYKGMFRDINTRNEAAQAIMNLLFWDIR